MSNATAGVACLILSCLLYGCLLAGRELMVRYRKQLAPRTWFRRSSGETTQPEPRHP